MNGARNGRASRARAVVALMRAVPALFTASLAVLGATWLVRGRTDAGLMLLAAAGGAAIFGIRIALASRLLRGASPSSFGSGSRL